MSIFFGECLSICGLRGEGGKEREKKGAKGFPRGAETISGWGTGKGQLTRLTWTESRDSLRFSGDFRRKKASQEGDLNRLLVRNQSFQVDDVQIESSLKE